MATEATKMAVRSNFKIDTRVDEVTEFNSEVRFELQGCVEATMSSEAITRGEIL